MLKKRPRSERESSYQLSRGGRTTNIYAVIDGLGNPIGFLLTSVEVHDSRVACQLLGFFDISQLNIIADKAYGTIEVRQYIEAKGRIYTIPTRGSIKYKWACDYHVYFERYLIENFFNQLKIPSNRHSL